MAHRRYSHMVSTIELHGYLAQRLQAIEDTSLRASGDYNLLSVDGHLITLGRHKLVGAHLDAIAALREAQWTL